MLIILKYNNIPGNYFRKKIHEQLREILTLRDTGVWCIHNERNGVSYRLYVHSAFKA